MIVRVATGAVQQYNNGRFCQRSAQRRAGRKRRCSPRIHPVGGVGKRKFRASMEFKLAGELSTGIKSGLSRIESASSSFGFGGWLCSFSKDLTRLPTQTEWPTNPAIWLKAQSYVGYWQDFRSGVFGQTLENTHAAAVSIHLHQVARANDPRAEATLVTAGRPYSRRDDACRARESRLVPRPGRRR